MPRDTGAFILWDESYYKDEVKYHDEWVIGQYDLIFMYVILSMFKWCCDLVVSQNDFNYSGILCCEPFGIPLPSHSVVFLY